MNDYYLFMRFYPLDCDPAPIRLADFFEKKGALEKFFKQQPVDLVFLHGSLAKDSLGPLSDVDIAILPKKHGFEHRHRGEIFLKLSELLGREDIDIMLLNRASPVACMQVLCNGKILYSRREETIKNFRLVAIQRYLATKHLRDSFNKYMQFAILGEDHVTTR